MPLHRRSCRRAGRLDQSAYLRDGKAGGMFMTGKLADGTVLTSAS
ncbi:MAG TPA: hypothetical protein VFU28_13690 [Vicinamibacterales bacterium]|nr:hypothetical protein [Vicinamibacterales bacterium]